MLQHWSSKALVGFGLFAIGYANRSTIAEFLEKLFKRKLSRIVLAVSKERKDETRPLWLCDKRLISYMQLQGITIEKQVWNDPAVQWDNYDIVIVHETWASQKETNYYYLHEEYFRWLKQLQQQHLTILNDPIIIKDFFNKATYYAKLADMGVNIIPFKSIPQGNTVSLKQLMIDNNWVDVVIKPESDSGDAIYRVLSDKTSYDDLCETSESGQEKKKSSAIKFVDDMQVEFDELIKSRSFIIQRFLPEIKTKGEVSCLFIDGIFQYAIGKKAGENSTEFRTQRKYSGQPHALVTIMADQVKQVAAIYEKSFLGYPKNQQPFLARIDVVFTENKGPYLMEIEAIDPWLYLNEVFDKDPQLAASVFKHYAVALNRKYDESKKEHQPADADNGYETMRFCNIL